MPVTLATENEITLPTGGTVRLLDSAIRRDFHVLVVCDGCGKRIEWSQIDVADKPEALPPEAHSIVKLSSFNGTERAFCENKCLVQTLQREQAETASLVRGHKGIHRVK